MRLIFARHGESEANILLEFSNRGFRHGLTEKGRQQAQALAHKVPRPVLKIYSSPLMRAVQTAEILSAAWGVEYEAADGLREFDCGDLEGTPIDERAWSLYREVMTDWLRHRKWESRLAGGESFLDIQARFVPLIERIVRAYQGQDGAVVCIGHGGTYRSMLPLVLKNIPLEFTLDHHLGNTEYILAEARPEGLICLEWCGTRMENDT